MQESDAPEECSLEDTKAHWRLISPMRETCPSMEHLHMAHGACVALLEVLIVGLCRNRICFENLYSSYLFQVIEGFLDGFLPPLFLLGYQS